jgi:hypothetical protein
VSYGVAVNARCVVSPLATGGLSTSVVDSVSTAPPGGLTFSSNCIGVHAGGLLLVTAMSIVTGTSGEVGPTTSGATIVGSTGKQVSWRICAGGIARSTNAASSITPSNRRSDPSLPISSGPGPGGIDPATLRTATCSPPT